MKFLVVGKLKDSYQTDRLKEEAEKRGHTLDVVRASSLSSHFSGDSYEFILDKKIDLRDYDLIYLLVVGKRGWDWFFALSKMYERGEVKVINEKFVDPSYRLFYTSAVEFTLQTDNDIRFPKSSIFFKSHNLDSFIDEYDFPVILKIMAPKLTKKGFGVRLVDNKDQLVKIVKKYKKEANHFILREFIPNDGDIRVFTVGYDAIGAMKRTPKEGEFRSNISQGGEGDIFDLTSNPDVKRFAEDVSELLRTEIAGVDIMLHKETKEPYLLEINRGPQFSGLEKYTDVNAAREIIDYFEKKSSE